MSHFGHENHAFEDYLPLVKEGLTVSSRRNMLKAGMAGIAGLSVPTLLKARDLGARNNRPLSNKSVILLWMTGGPSQIDTWDPKPDRPWINRGPWQPISTAVPGIHICEHLPKQAAMMDKFTIIRSVDCKKSNHEPNSVMQTGNREAGPRVNPIADRIPAIGSVIAKHRGANNQAMPPYVVFRKSRSHIAWAGDLGKRYDPFVANDATELPVYDSVGNDLNRTSGANIFKFPAGLSHERLGNRQSLLSDLDKIKRSIDVDGTIEAQDRYTQQAYDMMLGRRAQKAFDLSLEPQQSRDRYGKHLWSQQTLIARRLVEAGVSFVTIDLSYHGSSGTWDNHGIPGGVYGGISKGLGPLLPLYDHMVTTLVSDLEERGILDDTLVISMGEFGRTPNMGTQESEDGRNHWPVVMSMALAGGGLRHGQVIGSSNNMGAEVKDRPVTPGDLAATIYRHMQVPLDTTYEDRRGRPHYVVQENGQPIRELF